MTKVMKRICGETTDIIYDEHISKLNLELALDPIGTPVILFEDWTKKGKELFTLHIKEAIELKGMIDNLVVDYFMYLKDIKDEKK